MAYTISWDGDLLRVTLRDALTPEDLTGIMNDADEIEKDLDPIPGRITTLQGIVDIRVGYAEVRAFAWHRRVIRFPNLFKSALVVKTPVQRGIARMFQTLNDNPQIVIEIFDDEAVALQWLQS